MAENIGSIEALLQEDRTFPPSDEFKNQANINDPGVYEEAANDPEAFWARFAGAVSIDGPFPSGEAPLRSLRQARNLPIFLAQSRYSTVYPIETACQEMRLFHIAGLQALIAGVYGSRTIVIQRQFEPVAWMTEVANEGVQRAMMVPTMIKLLMDHEDFSKHDLSSLEVITYGAALSLIHI